MDDFTRRMIMGAAGAAGGKTYVDDVFSTYLYNGDGTTSNALDNGVDLTEGGLVWMKSRGDTMEHYLFDTARGATKYLNCATNANEGTSGQSLKSFNNNGFTLGDNGAVNSPSRDMASWSFRKAEGFFDVVTFTSTGAANQRITHSLGCEPGIIICKSLTNTSYWVVYHREIATLNPGDPWSKSLLLDENYAATTYASDTWGTGPTSTDFGFKAGGFAATGTEWVAYVFAGGESTAATARSVQLDGSGDWFTTSTSSDYTFGTGDFTVEHWVNLTGSASGQPTILDARTTGSYTTQWVTYFDTDYTYNFYAVGGNRLKSSKLAQGTWNHIAVVRSSGVTTLYVNGISQGTYADTNNYSMTSIVFGANAVNFGHNTNGRLSNLRVVKGTAVYTSSFKPPTQPLTNITNTKLLCFNNSSTTGTTVGTITASGNPSASTNSPFDDPEGYKFGGDEDQNIIKTGSYVGNGSANGPEIFLGWEPQLVLLKRTNAASSWKLQDSMRGVVTGGDDAILEPNDNSSEANANRLDFTSTGFLLPNSNQHYNGNGDNFVYMAIRRPDGYVGKPAEAGTDAFAMDTGAGSTTIPNFDGSFPVDFSFIATPGTAGQHRNTGARLTGPQYMRINGTNAESGHAGFTFDWNAGWGSQGDGSNWQSWMWKRHSGFDVVAFQGTATNPGPTYAHGLGKTPELKIIKRRNASMGWIGTGTVISQVMAGNLTSGKDYYFYWNSTAAVSSFSNYWTGGNDTATHFTVRHGNGEGGGSADPYLCLLFASVDGISKVGYYDGTGYAGHVITTGFTPRLLIIKKVNGANSWFMYDSLRGLGAGADPYLQLENTNAQASGGDDVFATSSTGFTINQSYSSVNASGGKYIYYAHA